MNTPKPTYRKRRAPDPRRRLILPLAALLVVVIVAVIVSAIVLLRPDEGEPAVPQPGQSAGAWQKNDAGYYFNDAGEPILGAVLKGIDVSEHQGEIDWQKAKDAGIDFAILRCGYGSEWSGEGTFEDIWPGRRRTGSATPTPAPSWASPSACTCTPTPPPRRWPAARPPTWPGCWA